MSYLQECLAVLLTAAVFQNAVFTRGLGLSKNSTEVDSLHAAALFGLSLTAITALASLAAWPLNRMVREYNLAAKLGFRYFASLTILVCISLVILLFFFVSRRWLPRYHFTFRRILPHITLNCAILGTILLSVSDNRGFGQAVSFAVGSGLGYTAALMLICEARRRIKLLDVPHAFRGYPIMLLYLGIFSMAIYGLIGHQIPT